MTESELVSLIAGTVVGGSGIAGLAFFFLRRSIEKKLEVSEAESAEKKRLRVERLKIENEKEHAEGRWFFWVDRYIRTGSHNGEYARAWEEYQKTECKKKELDRGILAEAELKQSRDK